MYLDIDFQPRHDIIDTSVVLYISGLKNTWFFFEIFSIKIHTLLHPFEQINEAIHFCYSEVYPKYEFWM